MNTKTKEVLTSQTLDKRGGASASENILYLNGKVPMPILTEYEFARAL